MTNQQGNGQYPEYSGQYPAAHPSLPAYPGQPGASPQVPPGTSAHTPWAWIAALLPIVSLVMLVTFDWHSQMHAALAEASDPTISPFGSMDLSTLPLSLVGWLIWGVTVVLALLDVRTLRSRGFVRPFHWAFAFLGVLVYLIGRTVVIRRRGASDFGPLVAVILLTLAGMVAAGVITAQMLQFAFTAAGIS